MGRKEGSREGGIGLAVCRDRRRYLLHVGELDRRNIVCFRIDRNGKVICAAFKLIDHRAVFIGNKGHTFGFADRLSAFGHSAFGVFCREIQRCCGIGRNNGMIRKRAGLLVKRPTAFDFAAHGVIRAACMRKAAAEFRLQDNVLIGDGVFVAFDAENIPEQPFGNCAVGEVVIRFAVGGTRAVRIGTECVPAFPNGGRTGGNAVQPRRIFLLFKQLIGHVGIAGIGQNGI